MKMNLVIKKLRKDKGLTQEQLAELAGVSLQTVRRWEWGDTTPNSKLLSDLAEALETTPEVLLGDNAFKDDTKLAQSEHLLTGDSVIGHSLGQQSIDSNSLVFRDKNREIILPNAPDTRALFRELVLQAMSGREVAMTCKEGV